MLLDIFVHNLKPSMKQNSYNEPLKKLALYLFYVGGRLLYQTLYGNMKTALPSISCLNKYVKKMSRKVEEGFFLFWRSKDIYRRQKFT